MEIIEECKKVLRKIMEKKEFKRRKEDQIKISKVFKKEIKLYENIELNKVFKVLIIVKLILVWFQFQLMVFYFLFWRNKNEFCVCWMLK